MEHGACPDEETMEYEERIARLQCTNAALLAALELVRTRAQQRQANQGILWDAITESAVTAAIEKARMGEQG